MLDYPTAPRGLEAVETLIASVEQLVGRLPESDSRLGRLRAQASNALVAAKIALANNVFPQPDQAHLNAWVRKWPRTALAITATLGLALGVLAVSCAGGSHRSTIGRRRVLRP